MVAFTHMRKALTYAVAVVRWRHVGRCWCRWRQSVLHSSNREVFTTAQIKSSAVVLLLRICVHWQRSSLTLSLNNWCRRTSHVRSAIQWLREIIIVHRLDTLKLAWSQWQHINHLEEARKLKNVQRRSCVHFVTAKYASIRWKRCRLNRAWRLWFGFMKEHMIRGCSKILQSLHRMRYLQQMIAWSRWQDATIQNMAAELLQQGASALVIAQHDLAMQREQNALQAAEIARMEGELTIRVDRFNLKSEMDIKVKVEAAVAAAAQAQEADYHRAVRAKEAELSVMLLQAIKTKENDMKTDCKLAIKQVIQDKEAEYASALESVAGRIHYYSDRIEAEKTAVMEDLIARDATRKVQARKSPANLKGNGTGLREFV